MSVRADGGGGSSGPLDGSAYDTTSDYYQPGTLPGAGNIGDGPDGEGFWSAAWSGGGEVHGKVEDAMKAAQPDGLKTKATAWTNASTDIDGYLSTLSGAWGKVHSAWSGDDADQAHQIFNGLYKTLSDQYTNSSNMGYALSNMHDNLKSMKDTWGHDESTWGGVSNWATGDDDRASADDYKTMMSNFKTDMGTMPRHVPTQVKPSATPTTPTIDKPGTHQGAGGAPSVGGAGSAPHTGNPGTPHITQPELHNQNQNHHGPVDPPVYPPPPTNPPTTVDNPDFTDPSSNYDPSGVSSPYTGGGGGIGVPAAAGLNTDGSLAGVDPSLAGGGAGVGGLGGGLGGGAGAGGAGLSGLGAGAGAGGAGLAGGAGAGAGGGVGGVAGTAGGASGAGGRGAMMPMHGAGQNDEDERDRSTWLSEDEDVWGNEDDVPGVIR